MTTETKFTVGEYKTREERAAKVFIVNDDGTLIGARKLGDGSWTSEMWFSDGRARVSGPNPHDLMLPLRECWRINCSIICFNTREEAEERAEDIRSDGGSGDLTITKYREVRDDQA